MILQRYVARMVFSGTALTFAALLLLFGFFDLIKEMGDLGKGEYHLPQIIMVVLLGVPGHIYELFPIAALIGTVFALGQLVANSEYTVMRVSGLSNWSVALMLLKAGLVFGVMIGLVGEFVSPQTESMAQQLRLRATSSVVAQEFRSGLWVRDDGSFVNVKEVLPDASLRDLKIYEFDKSYALRSISHAKRGIFEGDNRWRLTDVVQTRFDGNRVRVERLTEALWHSVLNPGILSVLLIVPEQMSAHHLYDYAQHLRENGQKTSRYEIALWNKLVYPFAALVMMLLALPFTYHHRRGGGMGGKIFAGIMLGVAFHLVNKLSTYLAMLNDWWPPLSAMLPATVFLSSAVIAVWWLERR